MLNIAICDDDDLIAHQIESVLHNIGDEENVKIDTDVFYSGNDLVREISSGKKFDLIYMDIQMENGDGITAAKNIRKKDEDAMIIFISSYDRYVMELFRLDVFSFIRKPIDRDLFAQIFLEANQRICSRNHFFSFKYKSQEYKVLSLYRKFLKSSEIVYNRLEIKNDITKERRGLRHDVVYEVFCFGLG